MDVLMPQLGETVAEGKIVKWFKKVGDTVAAGESVATIEAMKMEAAITASVAGTVVRLAIPKTQQVDAGDLLVEIKPL